MKIGCSLFFFCFFIAPSSKENLKGTTSPVSELVYKATDSILFGMSYLGWESNVEKLTPKVFWAFCFETRHSNNRSVWDIVYPSLSKVFPINGGNLVASTGHSSADADKHSMRLHHQKLLENETSEGTLMNNSLFIPSGLYEQLCKDTEVLLNPGFIYRLYVTTLCKSAFSTAPHVGSLLFGTNRCPDSVAPTT